MCKCGNIKESEMIKEIHRWKSIGISRRMRSKIAEVESLAMQIFANPDATEQDVMQAREVIVQCAKHKHKLKEISHGL
jgi:hypothetical protein